MDRLIYKRKLSATLRRLNVILFRFNRYCLTPKGLQLARFVLRALFCSCRPCKVAPPI